MRVCPAPWCIGDAVARTGLPACAIQKLVAEGVVPDRRSPGGWRSFTDEDLAVLSTRAGKTTNEVARYLGVSVTKLRALERKLQVEPPRAGKWRRYPDGLVRQLAQAVCK